MSEHEGCAPASLVDALRAKVDAADRAIARLVARADAAEAERDRLSGINRELVETHNTYLVLLARAEAERDAMRAQVEAAEWLIRTEHRLGHHDHHAANLACKGCAWLEDYDLSSSEPVTAGPEDVALDITPCAPNLGVSCGECHRCTPPTASADNAVAPAGEVTPPAEQTARANLGDARIDRLLEHHGVTPPAEQRAEVDLFAYSPPEDGEANHWCDEDCHCHAAARPTTEGGQR